ncbi:hypothetical protein, partial [Kitasatospora sp. MBT63]|uniref:hypothetical protein n=1 Tax=Kitasatospora sp. MBT63 TaxID=1444768 RepID=UPI001313F563
EYTNPDHTQYTPARTYNTDGYFTSRDTYQLHNRYAGFGADPVNHTDPSGHMHKRVIKAKKANNSTVENPPTNTFRAPEVVENFEMGNHLDMNAGSAKVANEGRDGFNQKYSNRVWYHGTSDAESILNEGFRPGISKTFGEGAYFAKEPGYSATYGTDIVMSTIDFNNGGILKADERLLWAGDYDNVIRDPEKYGRGGNQFSKMPKNLKKTMQKLEKHDRTQALVSWARSEGYKAIYVKMNVDDWDASRAINNRQPRELVVFDLNIVTPLGSRPVKGGEPQEYYKWLFREN